MKGFIITITILLKYLHASENFNEVEISDVIRAIDKPKSIIALLCCSQYKKIKFYKALNKQIASQTLMQFSDDFNTIPPIHVMEVHTTLLVDTSCRNASTFLKKSEEARFFHSPYRWIIFSSEDSPEKDNITNVIPEHLNKINIYPDGEVMNVKKIENNFLELNFIYKVAGETPWISENYGVLKNSFEKSKKWISSTAIRRLNLNGYEIKIAFVITNNDSIHHLTDGIDDHLDTISKVTALTMIYLTEFLNAKKKIVFVDTWGYPQNNTWSGMTGCLLREEVEMGGTPMFFTLPRMPIIEFISSPMPSKSKFVFQQPKLSYEVNLFLLPFRQTVWLSICVLLFLMFLVLCAVAYWERKKNDDSGSDDAKILRANATDVALLVFGATCQQGGPVELKGALGRIVLLILFLTVLFLHTSFSANIVALLQSSSSKIRTVEDLLNSRLKFGVEDNSYNRHYFTAMTEPTRKALYETKVAPPGVKPRFLPMKEGVARIREGLFAFHMETGVGYKFVSKTFEEGEKCRLYEIQYLQVSNPWLPVRKKSPYMKLFKIATKRLIEHGLQYRENRRFYEPRPTCAGGDGNFVSVSMVDCYPAMLVLTYGTLIASVLLAIELLYRYKEFIIRIIKREQLDLN